MSSRDRRAAAARRKKAKRSLRAPNPADLQRPLRLIVEGVELLDQYGELLDDTVAAWERAETRLRAAADRIAELTAPYDAFDILALIQLHQGTADPETYKETEHEGSLALIELVALVLAARGTRARKGEPGQGHHPNPAAIVDAVVERAREAIDAGSMMQLFRSASDPDPIARLSFGTVLREVSLRNSSYPHMVRDTLSALFDEPSVAEACARVMGCTVREIISVFDALQTLQEAAWTARFAALDGIAQLASPHPTPEAIREGRQMWARAWDAPAECSVFTDESIAEQAVVTVEIVRRVRALFITPMVAKPPGDAAVEFFQGHSALRTRPLLSDPGGTSVVVHGALPIPAIRERVEEELRADQKAWDRYSKHRGKYLEHCSCALVAEHLPGSVPHLGLEYFVPGSDTELAPEHYSKLVEGDALLIADDVAVVIESKAVALRPGARTGDPLRLRQDLRRIVSDAAEQGDRMRRRILDDGGLRLRDSTWLDLSQVREVLTIAVSLEDLSGIATVTSELVSAGLLNDSTLPWTVSLHDLRIVSELVDRPAELLLYLRRRTEPDITRRFHAIDELDFFLHFLAAQFFAEPDPERVHRELPQLGAPRVRDLRRYRDQPLEMLTSRTDALDSWYFHQLGVRNAPAPKPCMNANPHVLRLIDEITARGEPGWLAMTATLIDGDTATQNHWGQLGARLAAKTRADGRRHAITVPGGTRRGNSFLMVWATAPLDGDTVVEGDRIREYLTAKKHQMQLDRGFAMLFDNRSGSLVATFYDNRVPGPEPDLDAVIAASELRSPDSFRTMPPPARKPRREKKKRRK